MPPLLETVGKIRGKLTPHSDLKNGVRAWRNRHAETITETLAVLEPHFGIEAIITPISTPEQAAFKFLLSCMKTLDYHVPPKRKDSAPVKDAYSHLDSAKQLGQRLTPKTPPLRAFHRRPLDMVELGSISSRLHVVRDALYVSKDAKVNALAENFDNVVADFETLVAPHLSKRQR